MKRYPALPYFIASVWLSGVLVAACAAVLAVVAMQ